MRHDPNARALIIVKTTVADDGLRSYAYEWEGPENGTVYITREIAQSDPEIFTRLPWSLVALPYLDTKYDAAYARADCVIDVRHAMARE